VRHRYRLSKLHAHAGAHSAEIYSKDCTGVRARAPRVGAARTGKVRAVMAASIEAFAVVLVVALATALIAQSSTPLAHRRAVAICD
jgi:hypothetical protein